MKFARGDVQRYMQVVRISEMNSQGGADEAILTSTNRWVVTFVASSGNGTIAMTPEEATVTVNNVVQPVSTVPHPIVTETVSSKGVLLRLAVNDVVQPPGSPNAIVAALDTFPVPSSPVKIGDSWKGEEPNPFIAGKSMTVTSTLLLAEPLYGLPSLKIKVEASVALHQGDPPEKAVKLTGSYNVDPITGHVIHAAGTIESVRDSTGRLTVYVVNDLIVPGVNDNTAPSSGGK